MSAPSCCTSFSLVSSAFAGEKIPYSIDQERLDYDGGNVWSSDVFEMVCGGETLEVYWVLTASGTGIDDLTAELLDADGDVWIWRHSNTTQGWRTWIPTVLYLSNWNPNYLHCEPECRHCLNPVAPFGGCPDGCGNTVWVVSFTGTPAPATTPGNPCTDCASGSGAGVLEYIGTDTGRCFWASGTGLHYSQIPIFGAPFVGYTGQIVKLLYGPSFSNALIQITVENYSTGGCAITYRLIITPFQSYCDSPSYTLPGIDPSGAGLFGCDANGSAEATWITV